VVLSAVRYHTKNTKNIMKLNYSKQKGQKVIIREKCETKFVEMEYITHLHCEGYLTTVHTTNSKQLTVSKLLKEFENDLADFGFVRANRSTIVNMAHVVRINTRGKRIIELTNNEIIHISRRRMFLFRSNQ
jgi:two-component system, LytTR family, response regulator